MPTPSYLADHEDLHARDPRAAALAWFREARYGLFLHYGLYSLLGRGEWVQFTDTIPLAEYEGLAAQFTAKRFDADAITDLACEAGMRYVNLTTRHHDSFCLWDSAQSDFTSARSPARRDLVAELAEQCRKKSLGLLLYYSYALDWRHPHFFDRSSVWVARPDYPQPEPRYRWRRDEDFRHYIDFVHAQFTELLTNYGPVAGLWFDPMLTYYARPDLFPIEETYTLIRKLQPQTLIAFKQGANGDEDFAAPERAGQSLAQRVEELFGPERAQLPARVWAMNQHKHNEICDTLSPRAWGYNLDQSTAHAGPDEVWDKLAHAFGQNCNLLLNTGPLPDGAIHEGDAATLREVGHRIQSQGWPAPTAPDRSSSHRVNSADAPVE